MITFNAEGPRGKVVFFIPRWLDAPRRTSGLGLPLESLSVAGALARSGFEVLAIDESLEPDLEAVLSRARDGGVALRCAWLGELYAYQFRGLHRFVETTTRLGMEAPMVLGGSLVTVCPPDILARTEGVDVFVHGLGEECLPELSMRLVEGMDFRDVPGISFLSEGRLVINAAAPPRNLSPSTSDFYREMDLTPYVERDQNVFDTSEPVLKVRLGRGCARACDFCYHYRVKQSRILAEQAVEDILYLSRRYDVHHFSFHELDFFSDRRRALRIADALAAEAPDIRWFALGSVADLVRLSTEEIARLVRGGCRIIEMGTESGSEKILRIIGKHHAPGQAVLATQSLLAQGINAAHNLIFGIPGELPIDRRRTLDLCRQILSLDPGRVILFPRLYQISPGTPLGDEILARHPGVDLPRTVFEASTWRKDFRKHRVFPWLSAAAEREIKDLADYYIPMMQVRARWGAGARCPTSVRMLSKIVDLRVATGMFGLPVDRWLYDHLPHRSSALVDAFAE